jgi:hypothetical protein
MDYQRAMELMALGIKPAFYNLCNAPLFALAFDNPSIKIASFCSTECTAGEKYTWHLTALCDD